MKRSNNRNPIKQWFITYPQWNKHVDVDTLNMEKIVGEMPPYKWVYIVQEEHNDKPGYHYHMSIILKHGITKAQLLEWFRKRYPNDYKRIDFDATRSFDDAADYCKKHSLIFWEDGIRPIGADKSGESLSLMIINELYTMNDYQRFMWGCQCKKNGRLLGKWMMRNAEPEASRLGISVDEFLKL